MGPHCLTWYNHHPASKLYENVTPHGGPKALCTLPRLTSLLPGHLYTPPPTHAVPLRCPALQAPALLWAPATQSLPPQTLLCAQLIKAAEQPVPGIRGLLEGSRQACPSARVGPGLGLEQGPAGRPHLLMMPFIWMSLSSCCRRSRSSPSSRRAWYSSTSFWVVSSWHLNRVSYSSSFLVEIRNLSCSTARSCQEGSAPRHSTQDRKHRRMSPLGGSLARNAPGVITSPAQFTQRGDAQGPQPELAYGVRLNAWLLSRALPPPSLTYAYERDKDSNPDLTSKGLELLLINKGKLLLTKVNKGNQSTLRGGGSTGRETGVQKGSEPSTWGAE